jgi:acyl dehydratase
LPVARKKGERHMRFFEDFVVGEKELAGTHTVAASEIRAFAAKWDPQPMHIASDHPMASGAHAMAIAVGRWSPIRRDPR